MIKYYISNDNKKLVEIKKIQKKCWIHLEKPTPDEVAEIVAATGISDDLIKSALDDEEVARVQTEDDAKLTIIDIPKTIGHANAITMPLALIQCSDYLISVCMVPTAVLYDFFKGKNKNVDASNQNKLVYQIMLNNAMRFLFYLRQIDKTSDHIQKGLKKSMRNKELLQLLEIQKTLVFFSASLTANNAVIQKVLTAANKGKSTEEEQELLEDVTIENRQALEMCSVYREIIKNTMDAFASVVNNNQNTIMKFLTATTIVLAIPTMIAGFWGMNTGVPFEGKQWGFWVAVGISFAISGIVAFVMARRKMF